MNRIIEMDRRRRRRAWLGRKKGRKKERKKERAEEINFEAGSGAILQSL